MDLWIRSQDRENLLKTTIVAMEEITENEEYWIYAGHEEYDPYKVFGIYKSKERALEVLDKIQEHIGFLNVEMGAGRFGELDFQADIVYEMPKE